MDKEKPSVAEQKIPLWIKVMWFLGITWVLSYVYLGLQHSPVQW